MNIWCIFFLGNIRDNLLLFKLEYCVSGFFSFWIGFMFGGGVGRWIVFSGFCFGGVRS